MGTPLPSALAMVTTSGTTPSRWWANQAPQRPSPVCTSSTMNRTPRSSQSRRTPWKYSAVAGLTPPSPCTGSRSTAATDGAKAASSSSRSSQVTWRNPSGSGWNASCLAGWPGGVERGQGAAVERPVGAHDHVPTSTAEPAGELQGALVRLGPRVREEHLAAQAPLARPARLADAEETIERPARPASPGPCRRGSRRAGASGPAGGAPRPRPGGCARGSSPRDRRGGRGSDGRPRPTATRPRPRTSFSVGAP